MNDDEKKIIDEKIEDEVDTDPGDEVVFEENIEVTGGDHAATVKRLKEQIKTLQKEKAEMLDKWQREKADFINLRKKDEEARKEFTTFAKEGLVLEFIPVLDSFESAMKNKEAWEKVDANWRVGVEYIYNQLLGTLTSNGLEVVSPLGLPFSPERDEAIETVPVGEKAQDHTVVEVIRSGYKLHSKTIRPAKVKVGHYEG